MKKHVFVKKYLQIGYAWICHYEHESRKDTAGSGNYPVKKTWSAVVCKEGPADCLLRLCKVYSLLISLKMVQQ